jgi:hypothetical protein
MKTVKEAAAEYAARTDKANSEWVESDFIAGVKFAQRWISVDDELPTPFEPVIFQVGKNGHFHCGYYSLSNDNFVVSSLLVCDKKLVSRFRYIDLK